jgi:hypothetical protein
MQKNTALAKCNAHESNRGGRGLKSKTRKLLGVERTAEGVS